MHSQTIVSSILHTANDKKALSDKRTRPNSTFYFYLELFSKASDDLSWNGLPQAVHLDTQASSRNVCLPTSDELIKCIMDENILRLHV